MNFLVKPVVYGLMKFAKKYGRVVKIMDRQDDSVYMIRYIVWKSKPCSLYIHRFLRSDHDVHHDHPWNFFTYVVEKGYKEELMVPENAGAGELKPKYVTRTEGSLAYRKAESIHRVILDRDYSVNEQSLAPLTVCLLLNRRRIWGFVKSTKIGHTWTNWKTYLGIDENDPRFLGSE